MVENPKLNVSMDFTISVDYTKLSVIQLQALVMLANEELQRRYDERWGNESAR